MINPFSFFTILVYTKALAEESFIIAMHWLKERSQSVLMLVAAESSPLGLLLFQILGFYLKRFLFYGHLKKSHCWIVTNFVTTQKLSFVVCDVTNSIVRNFKS